MLMALDHVYMHIGVTERDELSWPIHLMQAGEKLQQLDVVFLVEVYVGSVLFLIR